MTDARHHLAAFLYELGYSFVRRAENGDACAHVATHTYHIARQVQIAARPVLLARVSRFDLVAVAGR